MRRWCGEAWSAAATTGVDELYALLKRRQLERARAALAGVATDEPEVKFTSDLYTASSASGSAASEIRMGSS